LARPVQAVLSEQMEELGQPAQQERQQILAQQAPLAQQALLVAQALPVRVRQVLQEFAVHRVPQDLRGALEILA
jgi:hypothetical protein